MSQSRDVNKPEEKELSKLSIGIIIVIVTIIIGGIAYLFFWEDEGDEVIVNSTIKGKTVPLSESEINYLNDLAVHVINEAGNFGIIEDSLDNESIALINNTAFTGSEIFDEYFITRATRIKQMVEDGLIDSNGKANLNTSRWDSSGEIYWYADFSIENVTADVPTYTINEDTGSRYIDIPVVYTSKVTMGTPLMSEAPEDPKDARNGISTNYYIFNDNKAILTFVQIGEDDWKLYEFSSNEPPYTLVFWTKPNFDTIMEKVDRWEQGEIIEFIGEEKIVTKAEDIEPIEETVIDENEDSETIEEIETDE